MSVLMVSNANLRTSAFAVLNIATIEMTNVMPKTTKTETIIQVRMSSETRLDGAVGCGTGAVDGCACAATINPDGDAGASERGKNRRNPLITSLCNWSIADPSRSTRWSKSSRLGGFSGLARVARRSDISESIVRNVVCNRENWASW